MRFSLFWLFSLVILMFTSAKFGIAETISPAGRGRPISFAIGAGLSSFDNASLFTRRMTSGLVRGPEDCQLKRDESFCIGMMYRLNTVAVSSWRGVAHTKRAVQKQNHNTTLGA